MEAKEKVAVITGASSGIGRQSALVLLEAGYSVVLAGRRAELLDSAIEEAGAPAGKALAVTDGRQRPGVDQEPLCQDCRDLWQVGPALQQRRPILAP